MLSVGLTGNVGAGKSTVVALFAGWGATVIDTDVLAREVVERGSPALGLIAKIFGDEVVTEEGELECAASFSPIREPASSWRQCCIRRSGCVSPSFS
jgi:dephospho-CoA kinase